MRKTKRDELDAQVRIAIAEADQALQGSELAELDRARGGLSTLVAAAFVDTEVPVADMDWVETIIEKINLRMAQLTDKIVAKQLASETFTPCPHCRSTELRVTKDHLLSPDFLIDLIVCRACGDIRMRFPDPRQLPDSFHRVTAATVAASPFRGA